MALQNVILGGGCFWCIEAAFNQVRGVTSALSGYCGGAEHEANYETVCTGNTDHVEVVSVTFDNEQVTYLELLSLFFTLHDATQLNRQGNDIGSQYRSVIFYQDQEQKQSAIELIEQLKQAKLYDKEIVTAVEAAQIFYPAEDYHQEYFINNSQQGYCMAVVAPKIAKFRVRHHKLLK